MCPICVSLCIMTVAPLKPGAVHRLCSIVSAQQVVELTVLLVPRLCLVLFPYLSYLPVGSVLSLATG